MTYPFVPVALGDDGVFRATVEIAGINDDWTPNGAAVADLNPTSPSYVWTPCATDLLNGRDR